MSNLRCPIKLRKPTEERRRAPTATKRNRQRQASRQNEAAVDNIGFYFRVLHERYNDSLKRHLRPYGLEVLIRPGFGFVLFALYEEGYANPSDTSRRTGIKPSTLTAITDQMVKAGLIERQADEEDRRGVRLRYKGSEI